MPSTHGDTPLKLFRFKYQLEGSPWSHSLDIRAIDLDAAWESWEELNASLGYERLVEFVVQLN